jgi:hypothetical protein
MTHLPEARIYELTVGDWIWKPSVPLPTAFQLNLHREVASRTGGHQLRSRNRYGVLVSRDGVPVTLGTIDAS